MPARTITDPWLFRPEPSLSAAELPEQVGVPRRPSDSRVRTTEANVTVGYGSLRGPGGDSNLSRPFGHRVETLPRLTKFRHRPADGKVALPSALKRE